MRCARLNLQERSKPVRRRPPAPDKPRRYCQRRMINPDDSEDPRFHTHHPKLDAYMYEDSGSARPTKDGQNLVLSVQNLKFQGDVQERRRPRTSFQYKSLTSNIKHRMFVKQVVEDIGAFEEDLSSELTSYYFDDYVKYILSADRSRPSSSKSSIFLQDLSNKFRENKSTQVENKPVVETKKTRKVDSKGKNSNKQPKESFESVDGNEEGSVHDNTNVAFCTTGKRKSLTISRAQSPETIQIIRVDVVCNNNSNSALSDYEENKKEPTTLTEKDLEKIDFKTPYFADKYLLTNTIKSINENLSCGSKVTLLCKTFKLSNRSKGDKKHKNGKEKKMQKL